VTAAATARALVASGADRVTHVITGDDGDADEDVACADLIQALVTGGRPPGDTVERVQQSRAAEGLGRGVWVG
jgi:2-phosphosulfolactate phosphatase